MEVKLYVGNLSYETSEDELRRLFTQTGTVNDVAVASASRDFDRDFIDSNQDVERFDLIRWGLVIFS